MYSLANETVKVSTTYRDFIVNILNYLSTRTLWANTSMVDSLVNLPSKKVVHRAEILQIYLKFFCACTVSG